MKNHQGYGRRNRHILENQSEKEVNIRYLRKITNEMLYNTTNQKPWSQIVKRSLSFFGHMARLPDDD